MPMHPKRKRKLIFILAALAGLAVAAALLLSALSENINLFYPPDAVAGGTAPVGQGIRAGGMVKDGSVKRASDSLQVSFVLTDYKGSEFTVSYTGILPDLFREGQGILVQGQLDEGRIFQAREVLAKHDENYMPPELADMAEKQKP